MSLLQHKTQELLNPSLIDELANWVRSTRSQYFDISKALPEALINNFKYYFPKDILENTRYLLVDDLTKIEAPNVYQDLVGQAMPLPIDFGKIKGLTLIDLLLIDELTAQDDELFEEVVFRELVHVLQFEELGEVEFLRQYIDGWTKTGFEHNAIPFEVEAERYCSLYLRINREDALEV